MEKSKDSDITNIVSLSPRCKKLYKKFTKKADPKLLRIINDSIDQLETNSKLGQELSQDLKGMYSIHINQFPYRIVYEVEQGNPGNIITVHAIAHRNDVYSDLAKYLGLQKHDSD